LHALLEVNGVRYYDTGCAEPFCWTAEMAQLVRFIDGLSLL
jgi:hypothetical protein